MKNTTFYKKYNLQWFLGLAQSFTLLCLIWLVFLLVFRLFETALNAYTHNLSAIFLNVLSWGWIIDIVMWLKWSFFIFIFYAAVYLFSSRRAKLYFQAFIILFFAIHIGLIAYFNTSLALLGADLYIYSANDIKQTLGSSGGIGLLSVILFFILLSVIILSVRILSKKIKVTGKVSTSFVAILMVFTFFGGSKLIGDVDFYTDFENNLILNKSDYFYTATYRNFFPQYFETDIYADNYIGNYTDKQASSIEFEYTDEINFPFLHKETAEDVLSPFFKPLNKAPNIVIVLVEGLGRAYSNEDAYLGSFTPFLDSLSARSLYWKNFLSQGGRTFAVLPSLLGSLPFARNGFLDLAKMPEHLSLLNLLKFNGYHTSFYYGGNASFDNMGSYLKANGIDELRDENSFPDSYTKLPAANGFTWGFNDKEIFRHYLSTRPDVNVNKPQFSVILTIASHNPFIINEPDKYLRLFEERMDFLHFNDSEKSNYRDYKNQYASILYADDALRTFFKAYEKRSDYGNTIFLITGDHRMPEIPMNTKIDRYHVPLIIFSPLLSRTAQIASVSTHFDIAPSILAYLKKNHQIKTPTLSSWIGQGLDTTRSFQNLHSVPFIQNKTDMIDFIMGEYHLNADNLYQFSPDLDESMVEERQKKSQLVNAFNKFKKQNSVITNGGKILPDSLFKNYTVPK